jgi:hypothetical protein
MTEDRMLDLTTMLKLSSMMGKYLAKNGPEPITPFAKAIKESYDQIIDALAFEYTANEVTEGWNRIRLDSL